MKTFRTKVENSNIANLMLFLEEHITLSDSVVQDQYSPILTFTGRKGALDRTKQPDG